MQYVRWTITPYALDMFVSVAPWLSNETCGEPHLECRLQLVLERCNNFTLPRRNVVLLLLCLLCMLGFFSAVGASHLFESSDGCLLHRQVSFVQLHL